MRVAGIDLGTNTFLCLIADVARSSETSAISVKVIRDEVRVVRLGQGVHESRAFHPEALRRSEDTFKEFQEFIKNAGCEKVIAVATSAARDVSNAEALFSLGRKYGIPIEVVSGEREADLTFSGAMEAAWLGPSAVIDVGGGSTEIIFGDSNLALSAGVKTGLARASADVGAVRLTENFVMSQPISDDVVQKMREHVREAFQSLRSRFQNVPKVNRVVAVAGTPTTLAAVIQGRSFDADRVHGHKISIADLDVWTRKLAKMTVLERQKLAGMEPKRADVIVAGLICLSEALRFVEDLGACKNSDLTVSVRGLRFGIVKGAAIAPRSSNL